MSDQHQKRWTTRPISCTCEYSKDGQAACGHPTVAAYPALGGGWMALCECHAVKHLNGGVFSVEELIAQGEVLKP